MRRDSPTYDPFWPRILFPRQRKNKQCECILHLQKREGRKFFQSYFLVERFQHESTEVWTFTESYEACSKLISLPSSSSQLLKNTSRPCFKGRLDQHNTVLSMSLSGHVREWSGSIGELRIETNLCLSSFWFYAAHIVDSTLRQTLLSRMCFEEHDQMAYIRDFSDPNNMGEDRLQWHSILNSAMFEVNNNMIFVALPGLVLKAVFKEIPAGFLQDLSIIYVWMKACESCQQSRKTKHNVNAKKGRTFFQEQHRYMVLSPNLNKYFAPPLEWTWFAAHRKCRLIGENLPSFVSGADV